MVMEAGETLQVKEGVDQETIDAVREVSTYKYGWDTDIEMEYAPKGVNDGTPVVHSSKYSPWESPMAAPAGSIASAGPAPPVAKGPQVLLLPPPPHEREPRPPRSKSQRAQTCRGESETAPIEDRNVRIHHQHTRRRHTRDQAIARRT